MILHKQLLIWDLNFFLRMFHKGKQNAIIREDLLRHARGTEPDITDRDLRRLYSEEMPVCSCEKGIYWPESASDFLDFKEYLRKKADPLDKRFRRVVKSHAPNIPEIGNQMELFG